MHMTSPPPHTQHTHGTVTLLYVDLSIVCLMGMHGVKGNVSAMHL